MPRQQSLFTEFAHCMSLTIGEHVKQFFFFIGMKIPFCEIKLQRSPIFDQNSRSRIILIFFADINSAFAILLNGLVRPP